MNNKPIGIFDSGLGGLTVLKEIHQLMPNENLIYFGDSKRSPYGTKSKSTIVEFSFQNIRFLLSQGVKAVVIACNTASSNAIEEVQKHFSIPIIEVIKPGAEDGIRASKNKKIGVIGTDATIHSRAYEKEILAADGRVEVFQKSCPLFVPLVEESSQLWNSKVVEIVAEEYLRDLLKENIDTLILGCTHYPLIQPLLQRLVGEHVIMINSAQSVAKQTWEMLQQNQMVNLQKKGQMKLFTSDRIDKFLQMSSIVINESIDAVEKIDIERY